jgi:signal transduction histidine kinase/DNA-binding response OmpR family regulator/CHASE3 domain sensor protein
MKSTFQRNLLVGFGLSLFLLIVSSIASYISIKNLLGSVDEVQRTDKIIRTIEQTLSTLKDAETGQRGYLLTGRDRFLEPYNGAYDVAMGKLQTVREMTFGDAIQQNNCMELGNVIGQRLKQLQTLIDLKRQKNIVDIEELEKGKIFMDQARRLVQNISDREEQVLLDRTGKLNKSSANTPLLILIAAILSIAITLIFFFRINGDFKRRQLLQKELEDKDQDIARRIHVIQGIAEKVSAGDYEVRASDEGEDGLGSLSVSLNKMAESLSHSFRLLSDKEWLQAGVAKLNTEMIGDVDIQSLSAKIVAFVSGYTRSLVGVIYLLEDNELELMNSFAYETNRENTTIRLGEGLAGQAALSGKTMVLDNIPESNILISYATGKAKPKSILATPVFYETKIIGVIELASMENYTQNDIAFIETVSPAIGTSIVTANNRKQLQELLEETQSQSEELQAQHNELENVNSELETQAQKLQASDEEMKVQQEELIHANNELEEKARQLEEKNQLINERNILIQNKAEQLAASTKYKSEFLANMSHELRTPLNSILLLSRLMSDNNESNLSEEQIEYAKVIQSSGQGLLALINEILDLSKIEAGKMDLQFEQVFVHDVIKNLSSIFQPLAQEKQIGFLVDIDQDVPGTLETDTMRLEQVLKNLIANALKFTGKGSVGLHVSRKGDHLISFAVTDTGIGISEDKRQLIFEAFQQEDGSTRRKYGGTGLGLSISRELAKLLGGEISLESEVGKGSTFTLSVPLKHTEQPKTAEAIRQRTDSITEEIPSVNVNESKYLSDVIPPDVPDDRKKIKPNDKVILIVEDDVNFAKSLVEFTHKQGYKAIVSVRGDEAISLAKEYKPAGILLDVQLPVKDGLEAMDELKNDPATRHIPVHMMSSHEMKMKSLSKGAIDFISKPVAFEKMNDIFQKLEYVLTQGPQKVLIVEENPKHAKALAYFLETYHVNSEIKNSIDTGIQALKNQDVNCVILDMELPAQNAYETLEQVKKTPGLEHVPIIIFTGKSLSRTEEQRIRQYADSIVVKTAYSYQRIIDEVSIFLHLVEENTKPADSQYKKLGMLHDVLKGKTVLIADDDVRNIYSLTRALENLDMNVISAMDGKEALQKLDEIKKVDVVLMDMMMPEMDGYTSIQEIRKQQPYRNLPIIAVTAKAMLGDREKCINAGASDYITKPVDIDQLLSLLRVWLYDAVG